ncbi:MAG: hypothetical protein M1826_002042 [Phylliscum demangeonii]|nr:MAG: hypothetical protein M1826_002042 [Phylliscum demangeonii]
MSDAQKAQEKDKLFARNSTLADLEPVTSPEAAKLRASCWDNWVREMRSLAEDTALAWELYWEMVFKSIGHKLRVLEEAETEA